ncbi:MAG: metal ABC transporter permease [Patescibacteria group bacterium]
MLIFDFWQYEFIQRAYLAGALIAILSATLGLFLVLRRLSLIGDGLSHVSFGAIALALFFGLYPFYLAVPLVLIASFFIFKLSEKSKMYGDSAIGIVSSVGIAAGVILASLSNGFNVDLLSYLFGNILAISQPELYLSLVLSGLVLVIILFFYNDLFSTTFDEAYAKISGIKTDRLNLLLISLTAITVVLAIKMVGIMLISALLILPATSALQIAKGFKVALMLSSAIAVFSVLSGLSLSFYANLPAGATIVMVNFLVFVFLFSWQKLRFNGH